MSITETDTPEFTVAMRGYDRLQVSDYIERLRDYAAELEDRVARAETRAAEADRALGEANTPAALAPRLERILALAEEEAAETRRAAHEDADDARRAAREEAASMLASARAESDALLAAAHRRCEVAAERLEDLDRRRRSVLDDLRSLAAGAADLADRADGHHDGEEVRAAGAVDAATEPATR